MNEIMENSEKKPIKHLEKIMLPLVLMSLLVPLIFDTKAYFLFNSPRAIYFMATAQIIFLVWLLLAIHNKSYRPASSLILIMITLFIGSLTLSTVLSPNPSISFWSNHERMMGLLMHLHIFAFFLAISSFFKTEKDWNIILGFSVFIASLVSVIGIFDNFGIFSLKTFLSNGSTLGNTSFMGTYLLIGSFLAVYLFLKAKNWNWKIIYLFNFILIFLGITLNPGGRAMKGALLAGFLFILIFYLAFAHKRKIIRNAAKIILILGVISAILLSFAIFQEGNIIRDKASELRGMQGRLVVWEGAWQGFLEKPVFGWGAELFDVVFLKNFDARLFLPEYGEEVWFDRAHNIVFDSLVSVGAVGTILFFGLFAVAIFSLWKKHLYEKKIDFLAPVIFSSLFLAHFIQSLTVFDLISSYMLLLLSLAFISFICREENKKEAGRGFNYLSLIVLIPFYFSFSFFVIQPYKSNIMVASTIVEPYTSEKGVDYYRELFEISPMGKEQIRRQVASKFFGEYKKEIEGIESAILSADSLQERIELERKLVESKNSIREQFVFFKQELNKNTTDAPIHFRDFWGMGAAYNSYFEFNYLDRLVESYSNQQQEEDAEIFEDAEKTILKGKEYIRKAIELSPGNQRGYWEMAQAKINQGKIYLLAEENEKSEEKFKEAFHAAEQAVDLEKRLLISHIKVIDTARAVLRDDDLARKKIREVILIDPLWEESLREKYSAILNEL